MTITAIIAAVFLYILIGFLAARIEIKYMIEVKGASPQQVVRDYVSTVALWPLLIVAGPLFLVFLALKAFKKRMIVDYAEKCKQRHEVKKIPQAKVVK